MRLSAAFQRLKKVRTFYYLVVGIGVLGFALVAVPGRVQPPARGLRTATGPSPVAGSARSPGRPRSIAIPIAGRYGDRLFRRDPTRALRMIGRAACCSTALFITVGLRFESPVVLVVLFALANACQGAAFTTIGPAIAAVVPYRMRAQAFALVGVYIFLMGGFFGGLLAGAFSDAWGERTALTIIVPAGGAARRAAHHVRRAGS